MAEITNKQKIMGGITAVVLLIVIWMIYGMFTEGSSSEPSTEITPVSAPGAKPAMTPTGAPAAGSAQQPAVQQQAPQVREAELPQSPFLAEQRAAQEDYIKQLNNLQMLRIERDISETQQAIAASKLARVKAEKDVSDLLTKPMEAAVPAGVYAGQLAGGPPAPAGIVAQQVAAGGAQPVVQTIPTVQYVVISVSMQLNKWTAVLGYQGKLYNVSVGDVLPTDGSKVVSINKNGVVLRTKTGKTRKISMISSV